MGPSMQTKISDNQSLRFDVPIYLVIFVECYSIWQFGIIYYSGKTLSILGRTPLPVQIDTTAAAIVLGGIASVLVSWFLGRRLVGMLRSVLPLALVSTLLLFFPLPDGILTAAFYVQVFLCLLIFGCCHGLAILLYSERSALMTAGVGTISAAPAIILLQGEFFPVSYGTVVAVSAAMILLMLIASWWLPGGKQPLQFAGRAERGSVPKFLFAGLLFLVLLATLLMEMTLSIAEGTPHGTAILYFFSIVSGLLFLLLWRGFKKSPLRIFSMLLAVMCVGFILAVASVAFPRARLISCGVLGLSFVVFMMISYFGQTLFRLYPSRWIVPAFPLMILLGIIVHTLALEGLREHLTALYAGYGLTAAVMLVVYLQMEPYLNYHRKRFEQALPAREDAAGASFTEDVAVSEMQAQGPEPAPHRSSVAANPEAFAALSPTERIVTDLILQGFTFGEIADQLDMKENAQRFHRKNIYSKLGIHSRKELFALAGATQT